MENHCHRDLPSHCQIGDKRIADSCHPRSHYTLFVHILSRSGQLQHYKYSSYVSSLKLCDGSDDQREGSRYITRENGCGRGDPSTPDSQNVSSIPH
jgi:hypothetical protein